VKYVTNYNDIACSSTRMQAKGMRLNMGPIVRTQLARQLNSPCTNLHNRNTNYHLQTHAIMTVAELCWLAKQ